MQVAGHWRILWARELLSPLLSRHCTDGKVCTQQKVALSQDVNWLHPDLQCGACSLALAVGTLDMTTPVGIHLFTDCT